MKLKTNTYTAKNRGHYRKLWVIRLYKTMQVAKVGGEKSYKAMGLFVCGLFVFSIYAGAVGDMIDCSTTSLEDYQTNKRITQKNPNDSVTAYNVGIEALCLDKIQEGMAYIQRASDMGHIQASNTMASYYKTDGQLNKNAKKTKNQKNFDAMIYYAERTAEQIEGATNYPYGVNEDQPYLEKVSRTSAYIFTFLPGLYYTGYIRAIKNIINSEEKLIYEDALETLAKMEDSADRCLARPALSVWGERKNHTIEAMRVKCQAMKEFAYRASILEQERNSVLSQCQSPLKECPAHKKIIDELVNLVKEMRSQTTSISL